MTNIILKNSTITLPFLLLLVFSLCPLPISGQGYAAYAGLPVEPLNAEIIAGNGAGGEGDGTKSVALGSNIRKAPVAPIAPPRVPLLVPEGPDGPINTSNGQSAGSSATGNSVSYRPAPPPVRREARSEGECRYDATKWQMHPESAAANAVMFDRTSGLSCDQCLALCAKFQDHSTEWICRTVTYDHRWKICDLFAVNGTEQPYFLLDYQGRDYFEYMAALPPTDLEMFGISRKAERDSAVANSVNNYDESHHQSVTPAPSPNSGVQPKAEEADGNNKQCSCPCKALAELTAQKSSPLALNASDGEEEGRKAKADMGLLDQDQHFESAKSDNVSAAIYAGKGANGEEEMVAAESAPNDQNPIPLPAAENTSKHLAGVKPLSVSAAASFSGGNGGEMEKPAPLPSEGHITADESATSAATQEPIRVFPSQTPGELPLPAADISESNPTNSPIAIGNQQEGKQRDGEGQHRTASHFDSDLLASSQSSNSSSSPLSSPSSSASLSSPSISASSDSASSQALSSEMTSASAESSTQSSLSSLPSSDSSSSSISESSHISSSNSSSSSSFSHSSSSFETITITNSSSSSSSSVNKEEEAQAAQSSDSRKAFASKTFQPQKEVRVPFRKSLEKVARVGMRLFTDNGNAVEKSVAAPTVPILKSALKSACPRAGQIPHYVEIRGRVGRRNGKVELAKEPKGGGGKEWCMDACDNPRGHLPVCNSAQLTAKGCELSSSALNYTAPDSLMIVPKNVSNRTKYLEKICLDPAIAKSEKRRIFGAIPGFILVGHVQEVANAGSLAECLKSCLSAEADYGFVCKSLMYYPADQDQNCLMNSESRYSQPDVFVPEDQTVNMLYVDIDQPKVPLPQQLPAAEESEERQRIFRDSPMDAKREQRAREAWTRWSTCLDSAQNSTQLRHRYLKCKEAKDVRKCPKESVPCRAMPSLKIQRIWRPAESEVVVKKSAAELPDCLAVRDALGVKRCPYGMRWNGTKREFCTPPIDC